MITFTINKAKWKLIEKTAKEMQETYAKEHPEVQDAYAFGVTIYPQHEIWINNEMCVDQQVRTLKHELTHCFMWMNGHQEIASGSAEYICDLMSASNDFVNEVVEKFKKEKGL